MKRRELIASLERKAKEQGAAFEFVREGGSHSVYRYNGRNVVIPRHAEINEMTARAILRGVDK
ncbi:mRNA interferase HicA [Actinoplanes campanulatus]|uniref:mRNA interferase HicA n=1 Tax=Actinoplanes campanulatus TaxID=113559 RepID=A0A7W5AN69_9ACTN|nr:type II toxin-antitoxin system HicA family toxin [Actinoplanes campanulatus]MBB3099378.1 mRNA interferase HicA [Actinoplanes campanulatus]GGN40229.1 hypothetical protein GCM10010109_69080 [Actinoplanes campanulatus]GID42413.1 hypothetical protein Aca09nite_89190 [Actinoplanes campanulatus]